MSKNLIFINGAIIFCYYKRGDLFRNQGEDIYSYVDNDQFIVVNVPNNLGLSV